MFKSVIGYFIAATLFCACSGQNEPISPVLGTQKGAKVIPVSKAPLPVTSNLTTAETIQGLWKLSGYYQYPGPETNYTWNLNNPGCQLTGVWVNFHSTGTNVGTMQTWNYTYPGCGTYSYSDIQNAATYGSIIYEIAPTLSGESGYYDTGTIYAPLYVDRASGGNHARNGYSISFDSAATTMYWYNSVQSKTLIWVRASGGPSVP